MVDDTEGDAERHESLPGVAAAMGLVRLRMALSAAIVKARHEAPVEAGVLVDDPEGAECRAFMDGVEWALGVVEKSVAEAASQGPPTTEDIRTAVLGTEISTPEDVSNAEQHEETRAHLMADEMLANMEPGWRWVREGLKRIYLLDPEDEAVGEVWRDCNRKWWARVGCGCVLPNAANEHDAMLWLYDRKEHGH